MAQEYNMQSMVTKIKAIRRHAEALKQVSGGLPAVDKNADRILANVRMLEINISEAAEFRQ